MRFTRFIALGDSMTEGMTDEVISGNYRGWADRVADELAKENPEFTYCNLAIRGKLLHQVVEDQIPIAKKYVTGADTLISFHAGANDVLRPNYKPENSLPQYEKGVKELVETGATVIIFTVVDKVDAKGRTAELWHARFGQFNENIRKVAAQYKVKLYESKGFEFLADRRFLAFDRLHMNPEGHRRLAQAVLEGLGKNFNPDWKIPLPPAKPKSRAFRYLENLIWFSTFALPWIWRRIRGKSSGDGRKPKHEKPIKWPIA